MASLGLITGVLLFDDAGTALMLTIFAIQDSFGTACNITGDGALTLITDTFEKKQHRKLHKNNYFFTTGYTDLNQNSNLCNL